MPETLPEKPSSGAKVAFTQSTFVSCICLYNRVMHTCMQECTWHATMLTQTTGREAPSGVHTWWHSPLSMHTTLISKQLSSQVQLFLVHNQVLLFMSSHGRTAISSWFVCDFTAPSPQICGQRGTGMHAHRHPLNYLAALLQPGCPSCISIDQLHCAAHFGLPLQHCQ